jgi:redox-sensitive bicupin YhaK (pirin superfamily)
VEIFVGKFLANKEMFFAAKKDSKIWIQIISGNLLVNDLELESGDAVAILEEDLINIRAKKNSEFLLFDL